MTATVEEHGHVGRPRRGRPGRRDGVNGAIRGDSIHERKSWHEVSRNSPKDFGLPITGHAHEPETVHAVPITSDSRHFPTRGQASPVSGRTGARQAEVDPEATVPGGLMRMDPRTDGHDRGHRRGDVPH